jgi:hypothetical protein
MSNHKTTDEEFTEAVKTCFSIREVLHKINVVGQGGSYKTFHRRVKKLNLDISHFKKNDDKTIRKNLTVETIIQICKDNISRQSALFNLGLNPETGSNVSWIEKKIIQLNIDTSHWLGQGHLKGKTHAWSKSISFEEILIEESDYTATPRLKERLVKAGLLEYICSSCGIFEWMGSKLSLHLDHINGVNTDNRLENLRLLCPNCHSITPTYCRGAKGLISKISEEPKCGK